MTRSLPGRAAGLAALLGLLGVLSAAEPAPTPDLTDYRTVETAVKAKTGKADAVTPDKGGFLGVSAAADGKGQLVIDAVAADSPAARAGVKTGDVLLAADGQALANAEGLRERLRAKAPGESVKLGLARDGKPTALNATL